MHLSEGAAAARGRRAVEQDGDGKRKRVEDREGENMEREREREGGADIDCERDLLKVSQMTMNRADDANITHFSLKEIFGPKQVAFIKSGKIKESLKIGHLIRKFLFI